MFRSLWNDEVGFVLSAELVLVLTIGVLAMVVGLNAVAKAINQELFDLAGAFGAVTQSFFVQGFLNPHGNAGWAVGADGCRGGFGFEDRSDECDCAVICFVGPSKKIDRDHGPGAGNPE
jgi:hypothetical protein